MTRPDMKPSRHERDGAARRRPLRRTPAFVRELPATLQLRGSSGRPQICVELIGGDWGPVLDEE